jgi:hypothetical protein
MDKPRLKRAPDGNWQCDCIAYRSVGETPKKAYNLWAMYAMPGLDAYEKAFDRAFMERVTQANQGDVVHLEIDGLTVLDDGRLKRFVALSQPSTKPEHFASFDWLNSARIKPVAIANIHR